MIRTGLVSVSFRSNTPEEIISAVKGARLDAIEWGGDVHVPHGDTVTAHKTGKLCEENGISVPEYGSYYRIASPDSPPFEDVAATARALGAGIVRVWAGSKSSDRFTGAEYSAAVNDARRICALAGDITVCLECHHGTLTDEYHTALGFIYDAGMPNLKMFWQPNQYRSFGYNVDSLIAMRDLVTSVHVFAWRRDARFPLAELADEWREYAGILSGKDVSYMLEFMPDNDIRTLPREAETLKELLRDL